MPYTSMQQMMVTPAKTAPIPTQTYNAANIIGTPVPMVGDNKGRPPYEGNLGGVVPSHVVLVAIGLFAIGYILFHVNFER